nr:MAG TPA: hypothetical protein [Bacteriophage sp.]
MSKARHIYNVFKFTNAGLDRSKHAFDSLSLQQKACHVASTILP